MKIKHCFVGLLLFLSASLWAQTYILMPTEKVTHCIDAGSYFWHDSIYNESGTYKDTDFVAMEVYTLKLTMTDHFERSTTLYLKKGNWIEYNGKIYTKATKEDITHTGPLCDTIEHLIIEYQPNYEFNESKYLCGDTVFEWHDQYLYKSGTYRAVSGDTTYVLELTIDKNGPSTYDTVRTCKLEMFTWKGLKITKACDTTTTIPSKNGCDTVAHLHYTIEELTEPTIALDTVICGATPYYFHGKKYFGDNVLRDHFTSQYGCDSVVEYHYTTQEGTYVFLNDTNDFKKNPNYIWPVTGKTYKKAGLYIDSISNPGCKILRQLKLGTVTHDTINCCQGEKPIYEGQEVTTTSTFKKITYTPDEAWMETVKYTHYIFHANAVEDYGTVQICHGSSYLWYYDPSDSTKTMLISEKNGATMDGKDFEMTRGGNKCDKAKIKVKVSRYADNKVRVVRSLDSCLIRDTGFVRPSTHQRVVVKQVKYGTLTYFDTLRSVVGCDSIYSRWDFVCTKKVSPWDTLFFYTAPKPLNVKGTNFTTLGNHEVPLNNDSIYRFVLVEYVKPIPVKDTLKGCYLNLPAQKYGKDYYETGDYEIHYQYKKQPCDSFVIALHVDIAYRQHQAIDTGFCANTYFVMPFSKRKVTTPGTHYDTIPDGTGCDSIVPYHLTLWDNDTLYNTDYLYPGHDTIHWTFHPGMPDEQDSLITEPGFYRNIIITGRNCSKLEELRVIRGRSFLFQDTLAICDNDLPYQGWRYPLYEAGDYVDSLKTGCCNMDSVYTLHLTVNPTAVEYHVVPLFAYDTFYFYHDTLTLKDTVKSYIQVEQKDPKTYCKIWERVSIVSASIKYDTLNICYGEAWKGHIVTEDFFYFDTLKAVYSKTDSIVHHSVFVQQPVTSYTRVNLKKEPGEQYLWNGMLITQPGYYPFDTVSQYGCDSIAYLVASFCDEERKDTTITERPCEGAIIIHNNVRITNDTIVSEVDQGDNYCLRVITYDIRFRRTTPIHDVEEVYEGDSVLWIWDGKWYKEPGVYKSDIVVRTKDDECDSIYHYLTVKRPFIARSYDTTYLCIQDTPYVYKGVQYHVDSTFIDTTKNMAQKDSVYAYHRYQLVNICSDTAMVNLCKGDTIQVGHTKVYKPGYYTEHWLTKTSNLDSIARYYVRELPIQETYLVLEGCDSIVYSDTVFYYLGSEEPFFKDLRHTSFVTGCDSIEHLKLTIRKSPETCRLHVTYPDNEIFKCSGREYSSDGRDTIRIQMPAPRCDSVVCLDVHFYDAQTEAFNRYCCLGDSVVVSGHWFKPIQDTMINDTTFNGSFTYLTRYRVIVGQPYLIQNDPVKTDKQVVAGKKVHFNVAYQTSGQGHPEYYDVHFMDNGLERVPEDSTYQINMDDTTFNGLYPITMALNNDECIYPGKYKYTITLRSRECIKSTVTDTLSVQILYPSELMYPKWNNVVALTRYYTDTINDADCYWDLTAPYEWYVNGAKVLTEGDKEQPYFYLKDGIEPGTLIQFSAARTTSHQVVSSYAFSFANEVAKPGATGKPHLIGVSPTIVGTGSPVTVETDADGEYELYHQTGEKCRKGSVKSGVNTVYMPGIQGCYLMQVRLEDGTTAITKLIVF